MSLGSRAESLYERANQLSGGRLHVLRRAFRTFGEARGAQAAASMAYYAFFSLFPLLLALVAAAGFFVADDQARQRVLDFVSQAIPVSRALIQRNVQEVLALREPVGVLALVTLLWSAAGYFTALAYNINYAFEEARPRTVLARRLVGLAMIGVLFGLLVLSLLSSLALTLIERLQVPVLGRASIYQSFVWQAAARLVPWGFTLVLFLLLYRWVPNTKVRWVAAVQGALVVASVWEGLKEVFAWYLGSGLVRYELVYGSLGAVVALLLWIYMSSWLVLFGAHLTAAIAANHNRRGAQ